MNKAPMLILKNVIIHVYGQNGIVGAGFVDIMGYILSNFCNKNPTTSLNQVYTSRYFKTP